ncbi:hypothetical protein NM688_g7145 [Phlebia brevispora]|uniref:Uncharacterized protein n=1 Tax=Phlebia brevispora TaxID=194682 RepID=A0ACC1S8R7_9APHY|nr:hypothetical protein NM688_g7145 [Phlebia brevispora]
MSGNPGNVARGIKAGITNPNVSEDKKQELRERLDDMESSGAAHGQEAKSAQVKQGHKANLNNPNTSEEAKQNSKNILDSM